jgi:hypothetical protein
VEREQGSEMEESKDQFSDKDSLSNNNFSQNGEPNNASLTIRAVDTHRDRTAARKDFMVNSHGPGAIRREEGRFETDVEVMVLQQQFKKNKRARVKQVAVEGARDQLWQQRAGWQQEEESLEEIRPVDGLSQAHSQCSHAENTYEIESIK